MATAQEIQLLLQELKDFGMQNTANASSDPTYSSGQRYAESIAGGENVAGMIAPGVSYSAARPEGYTQADLTPAFYNPGPAPVMPSAPTQGTPVAPNEGFQQMPSAPQGTPMPTIPNYTPLVTDLTSLTDLANAFNFNNLDFTKLPAVEDTDTTLFDIPVAPVVNNLPSVSSSPIDFSFNPFAMTEVDPIPQPVDVPADPMPTYFVPEVPSTPLQEFNEVISGPVGMPFAPEPQGFDDELRAEEARDELKDIIASKEILQEIPAEDGIRNEYQMAINDFINESPINEEVYKEELPVGSAINLGIPSLFENVVVPMAVPGINIAKQAAQSFNNSPSPAPSPAPSFSAPKTGGIDYSNIYRFGR